MLRGRAAPRWLWITPVPDDEIIRKKNEPLTVQASECTLNEHVFCLDNGEELTDIIFQLTKESDAVLAIGRIFLVEQNILLCGCQTLIWTFRSYTADQSG